MPAAPLPHESSQCNVLLLSALLYAADRSGPGDKRGADCYSQFLMEHSTLNVFLIKSFVLLSIDQEGQDIPGHHPDRHYILK